MVAINVDSNHKCPNRNHMIEAVVICNNCSGGEAGMIISESSDSRIGIGSVMTGLSAASVFRTQVSVVLGKWFSRSGKSWWAWVGK